MGNLNHPAAGRITSIQYRATQLHGKGKKILVICPYPEGVAPSQRLKFEQYYDSFRKDGWQVSVSTFIEPGFWKIIYKPGHLRAKAWYTIKGYVRRVWDLTRLHRYDLVYLHLWATPFGPPLFEWLIRKLSKRLVYDIDDLVYLKDVKSQAHPIVNWIKGRKKPLYLMRSADHVVTCTPYLDQFVRTLNKHTTDISSTVDTARYIPVNQYVNGKVPVIGWSGSLSTSKYIYLLAPVLRQLASQHKYKLLVMGDPAVRIEGVDIEALAWEESIEVSTLQRFDIGIYPLPDEEWVYGKSGLKAIQYMALGIPTVATAIGANFRVIEHNISGLLVRTETEWLEALSDLLINAQLRKDLGMAARSRVEQLFSIESNKTKYLDILNSLTSPAQP